MLFKVGQTSEAGIVSKFLQSTKQEEIQEQPSIQTSIFGEDNAIFNEIEIMAPHANTEKELEDYLKVDFIGRWHLGKDIKMNYYNQL